MSDPFFSDVASLLHFDGSDASTTFTDVKGVSWTAQGNAQLDTDQKKWGTASGLFDGAGDYLSANDASLHLGSSDWTIELWVRINAYVTDGCHLYCNDATNGLRLSISETGKAQYFHQGLGIFSPLVQDGPTLSTGTWYHFAVTNASGTIRAFIDGVKWGEDTSSINDDSGSAGQLIAAIGTPASASAFFNGWIDDFRLTIGTARYTANFTPPSEAFPDTGAGISGTLAATEGADTADFAGTFPFVGSITATEGADTANFVGEFPFIGAMAATEGNDDADFAGYFKPFIAAPRHGATQVYRLTLSDPGSGLADLVLPMTSFQARVRSGTPSYLSAVIPGLDYIDDINARANGEFYVEGYLRYSDGEETAAQELARANFERLDTFQGGNNASLVIVGTKQTTYSTPQIIELDQLIIKNVTSGANRWRAPANFSLRPLDTADYLGDRIVVDEIAYTIGVLQSYMDITDSASA